MPSVLSPQNRSPVAEVLPRPRTPCSTNFATSASSPTWTPARPRRRSASSTSAAPSTRSATSTTATPPPTSTRSRRQKGITINSAAVSIDWGDTQHQHHRHPRPRRFHGRGRAVACASSTAPSASSAPSAASRCSRETVWFQANKYNVPRIAYVNKLDRMGADFFDCIEQMKDEARRRPGHLHHPGRPVERVRGRHRPDRDEVHPADKTDKTNVKYIAGRHPGAVQGARPRSTASSCSKPPRTPTTSSRTDPRRQAGARGDAPQGACARARSRAS